MDSYSEVRRVRKEMSARVGHDIRALIASINGRWPDEASRANEPGMRSEPGNACNAADQALAEEKSSPAAR